MDLYSVINHEWIKGTLYGSSGMQLYCSEFVGEILVLFDLVVTLFKWWVLFW